MTNYMVMSVTAGKALTFGRRRVGIPFRVRYSLTAPVIEET